MGSDPSPVWPNIDVMGIWPRCAHLARSAEHAVTTLTDRGWGRVLNFHSDEEPMSENLERLSARMCVVDRLLSLLAFLPKFIRPFSKQVVQQQEVLHEPLKSLDRVLVWLYCGGVWHTIAGPPVPSDAGDWMAAVAAAGYEAWLSTASPEGGDTIGYLPLVLRVFRRRDTPRFLIDIDSEDGYETVYAEGLPDLMDLLARWLPAVQGAAAAAFLGGLADGAPARPHDPVHPLKAALLR